MSGGSAEKEKQVFRTPDLVSPHNSASAVSQSKMAFVLQSEQTGAGWPVAVIPGRQQEALFLMTLPSCAMINAKTRK